MKPINAKVEMDYKAYKTFFRFSLAKTKAKRVLNIITLIILFLGFLFMLSSLIYNGYDLTTFLFLIFISLVFLSEIYTKIILPKMSYKRMPDAFFLPYRYVFEEEILKISNSVTDDPDYTMLEYNKIKNIYETKNAFYLYMSETNAFTITKESLKSGETEALRELLMSKTNGNVYIFS